MTRHKGGWLVSDCDFFTVDKVLAEAVAKELDRVDPVRYEPDFHEARQRLYDLMNLDSMSASQQEEADSLLPIVQAGLEEMDRTAAVERALAAVRTAASPWSGRRPHQLPL